MLTKVDNEKIHKIASEKLQIIIVTYNRAKYLERTLNCLFDKDSPVKDVDVLVQNNCSTDNTIEVCKNYNQKYNNFSYITNRYNVGGWVNIAKAYENFTKEYLWILGDDDLYDWSNWNEVENAIFGNEQVILVSHTTLPECYKDNLPRLLSLASFMSAAIVSKNLITSTVVKNCYEKSVSLFPHLVPLVPYINKGGKFYLCKKEIVKWGGFEQNKSDIRKYYFGDDLEVLNKRSFYMSSFNSFIDTLSDLHDQQLKYAITRLQLEKSYSWWSKKRDGRISLDVIIDHAIKNHYFYNLLDIYQSADPEYQKYIIDKLFERKSELLNKEELDKSSKYLVEKDPFSEFSESQIGLYKIKGDILKSLLEQYLPCNTGKVLIWGTGNYGQYIYRTLTYLIPSIKIEAFVDSFVKENSDSQLFSKPIISPKNAYKKNKNDFFVIASDAYKQIISSIPKELNLKVIDSACRMYESFQMDFESHELQDLIGFSWADYSYAQQNSTEFISAKSNFSIFEDKQSRLCYEKLCSILFESNFEELTYFSSLDCNQNFIVDDDFARIKITDNNLDKINTSNNHQIKFARTEDDVIEVIQNYSENKSPLLVTVDVSFSKNEIVDKLPSLYSNIAIDVIVRSTDDLIELPKLYKEYLSNMKVYMSKNKDAQILMSFRKKN